MCWGGDYRCVWDGGPCLFLCRRVAIKCADAAAGSVSVAVVQRGKSDDAVLIWSAGWSVVFSAAGSYSGAALHSYRGGGWAASPDFACVVVVAVGGRLGC